MDVKHTVDGLLKCLERLKSQTKPSAPSIYRVASFLKDHNPSFYNPRVVSIGPLHREDENLQAGEEEKVNHMISLLNRLEDPRSSEVKKKPRQEKTLKACTKKVNDSIDQIRSCYAETIRYKNNELAKMMVIDGCFILEYLYRATNPKESYLSNMTFVQFAVCDLVLLGNQIPFLVLQHIFDCTVSKLDQTASLIDMIHAAVLKKVNPFIKCKLETISNTTHHHILGLLHECYRYEDAKSSKFLNSRFPSAVELDRAGVSFKRVRDTEWPLTMEVKSRKLPFFSFSWGRPTLIMPVLEINDITGLVLKTLIAYEQYSNVTQYVISYAFAIDTLIDSQEDIAKLVESKILVNHIGSNQEAAYMINSLCKDVYWRDLFYFDQ
ncbi:UPF0481 protein At3g47200-like [Bidens hawaiensis]|uniref:UPF0481 protein At3g47200-like n=1 Tax=Bidens hawaiensis TaxID=980011 RepID=UPI00404B8042